MVRPARNVSVGDRIPGRGVVAKIVKGKKHELQFSFREHSEVYKVNGAASVTFVRPYT